MRTTIPSGEGSSSQLKIPDNEESAPLLGTPSLRRKEKSPARSSQDNFYGTTLDHYDLTSQHHDIHNQHPTHNNNRSNNNNTSHDDDHFMVETTPQCRRSLCIIFVILMSLSGVAAVMLVLLTPEFAQRSFQEGVEFSFKQASIVNGTQHDLQMHVAGEISLKDDAYSLTRKASWIFGNDMGIRESRLEVYQEESTTAMGMIDLPPLTLASDSPVTAFDFVTHFTVTNDKELIQFAQNAVAEKMVSWKLQGPLALKLGWFGADVNLQKQIFLEGMDGLKQAGLQSVSFPGAHPLGGISLEGEVGIYNPSKMLSLRLGDIDFSIFLPHNKEDGNESEDKMIAVVRANDANLFGNQLNVFNVHGRSLPMDDNDPERQRLMEDFLSAYLHGNTSMVYVRGSPFGPDDNNRATDTPEWLRKALESLTLQVPFPGTKQTDMIQSLELKHIAIDFSPITGNPVISGDIDAILKKPDEMQFSINVTEIDPKVFLYLEANSSQPFGRLTSNKPCPAVTTEKEGSNLVNVSSRLYRAPFEVLPGKDKEFQKFLNSIFNGRRATVYIKGTADAVVDSAFGHLTVHDLEFSGQIDTKGMEGMQNPPPEVTSISLIRGYPEALHITNELVIENPSDVHVNLGLVRFLLVYKEDTIGEVTVPELELYPESKNKMKISGRLIKKVDSSGMVDFIGNYISGENDDTQLTISGKHPDATSSPLLKMLIQQMEFIVTPPRFDEEPLLAAMQMNIFSSTTVLWLRNPFQDIEITMIKMDATAKYESQDIGSAHADFSDHGEGWTGPLVLPPVTCEYQGHDESQHNCSAIVIETPKIPVMTKKLGFEAIKKALGGEINVSVKSIVSIMIDELVLDDLLYERDNLTAKIRKGF
ncbi:hypothetical protein BDA99DRAFT_495059 [Phascolomyces articulosus]|uniref:Uncharacterized protein n=1 Tax=Phascolomyces articulosus TaxID=60185 RepID=A0AAD5KBA0_9FUNG|nr:hypothetical protein BDA99DRAFT_495059 [Phascolomyces articulosus]